jgi:transcriptional regulator NrdR family protein
MYVIKANGKKEEFNPEKIKGSLTRARVDRAISDEIIEKIEKEVFEGISTDAIFKRVMALLNESLKGIML